jgi:hypothetical protein
MSGTMTVRELIVELLEEDMNDKVYIAHEDYPHSVDGIQSVEWLMYNNKPHGVYLFRSQETR